MKYEIQESINSDLDLLLPIRKDQLDVTRITNLSGIKDAHFKGDLSELRILYTPNGKRVFLLGLGEEKDQSKIKDVFQKAAFSLKANWPEEVQIDCTALSMSQITQAIIGLEMAQYEIGVYKSDLKPNPLQRTENKTIIISESAVLSSVEEGENIGQSINAVKTLVDAPANIKTPKHLSDWAVKSARAYGYDCIIKDEDELAKENFGAILAVGQGSQHPPRLIVCKYINDPTKPIDLGLVGKGITFDTGGISIKGSQNLHYMKSDMGGAAAVFGAIEATAKLKLNINIIGIVGVAENAVDGKSFLPSDVINSYSGKTIEIIDTDAEGRLVLADVVNYMVKEYQPKQMIDLATLTGSTVRTLGYSAAAMFSNNAHMSQVMTQVGLSLYERVWPLPLYEDFEADLHSDIADIRNFSGLPIAGAITAAKFIEAFTEKHDAWMHLDIAGVAFGSSEFAKMKSATGYGVRLLIEYMKTLKA